MPRQAVTAPVATVPPLVAFILSIVVLYFGRQILVPLALALLFAFLLNPIADWLHRLRLPRILAVLLVLGIAFGAVAGIGWVVTDQLIEIVNELPQYRDNIHAKIVAVQAPGSVSKLLGNIEDLGKELTVTPPEQPRAAPRKPAKSARNAPLPVDVSAPPQKVEIVEPPPTALQSLRNFAGPLIAPLETAGLVLIFTVFMLIDQRDLRNRLLGLIGQQQIHLTTKAMNDAATRVSRYLVMQFVVNSAFGAVVAAGLFLIGIPNVLLWGVMAMLLRFLPYVGAVLAAALPFLLAVATAEGWKAPLLVLALFLVTELITGNIIEPMLYGAHTGLSAVAILAAAVFWTVLWGPVGLILSTPLTVCLGVLGRYSPHLQFLDILLGQEPALPSEARFYQRLLALDQREALGIVEDYLKNRTLVDLFDCVIVPALAMAEQDRHGGQLEAKREDFVVQSIHEIVTELSETGLNAGERRGGRELSSEDAETHVGQQLRVFSLAAHDSADEITAAMLAQLATRNGYPSLAFPATDSAVELLEGLAPQSGDVICVSSVPPLALTHARKMSQSIRESFPDVVLIVGLWSYPPGTSKTMERLQQSTGSTIVTTMADAIRQISAETTLPVSALP